MDRAQSDMTIDNLIDQLLKMKLAGVCGKTSIVLDKDVYNPYVNVHSVYIFDKKHPCWMPETATEQPVVVID